MAARDVDRARVLVGAGSEDVCDGMAEIEVNGSNGGGSEEATALKAAGIPFEHVWDACPGAYESGREVFVPVGAVPGGDFGEAEAQADGVYALIDKDGEVDVDSLAQARRFLQLADVFWLYVGLTVPPRVLVEVRGGCVVNVLSDQSAQVHLLDWDDRKERGDDGTSTEFTRADGTIDEKLAEFRRG